MAVTTVHVDASPEQVFAVLADGWTYSNWVVGTSHMRAVELTWPAVGSTLFHASGAWPVVMRDETKVLEVEPGRSLTLQARGRPFGEATVRVSLEADSTGTTVTMTETPTAGPGKWLHNPASEALLLRRNVESLARLAAVAERRERPRD